MCVCVCERECVFCVCLTWMVVCVYPCVCVCVCKPVSQEKAKTVTFANDDMVLHYGGPHRHRRKSTPASLNRTPLHHNHNNPQYHQQQPSHLHYQQQHHQSLHHVLRSSPVSAHLRQWLAPGNSNMIETSKKSKCLLKKESCWTCHCRPARAVEVELSIFIPRSHMSDYFYALGRPAQQRKSNTSPSSL